MKLKYYMRGLGVGIIFSAIILSISFHAFSKTQISDKEIIKRAEQLGMEKTDINDQNLDDLLETTLSPTIETTVEPTISPTLEPTTTPTIEPTTTPTPTIEPTISPTIVPTAEPTSSPVTTTSDEGSVDDTVTEVKHVTLEVEQGMTSEKVASILKESGVIKDDKLFNQYMIKQGYATIIKMGEYQIPIDASFEQIVNIITGK